MNELVKLIFESYNFICKWHEEKVEFYINNDKKFVSFFLVKYIDGSDSKETPESILSKLQELENEYISENSGNSIKKKVQALFQNEWEAAQIDKNTSAIFPIKLNDLNSLDEYRNLIYSIEESPFYFRRFVIPYTESQVRELLTIIRDNKEKVIYETLSEIADDETAYYDLASHKNLNNAYELVIRLFSKIPFLQYNFKAEQKPMTVEQRIEYELSDTLRKYHEAVKQEVEDINQLLEMTTYVPDDQKLEEEINNMLRRNK